MFRVSLEWIDRPAVKEHEPLSLGGAVVIGRQSGKDFFVVAVFDNAETLSRNLRISFPVQFAGARRSENRSGCASHRGDFDLLVGPPECRIGRIVRQYHRIPKVGNPRQPGSCMYFACNHVGGRDRISAPDGLDAVALDDFERLGNRPVSPRHPPIRSGEERRISPEQAEMAGCVQSKRPFYAQPFWNVAQEIVVGVLVGVTGCSEDYRFPAMCGQVACKA